MYASVIADTAVVLPFSLCYLLSDWSGTKLFPSTILSVLYQNDIARIASGMTCEVTLTVSAKGSAFCSY